MLDTINVVVRWTPIPEIIAELRQRGFCQWGRWFFQVFKCRDFRTGGMYTKLSGRHEELGIWVRGKDFVIEWVQASLPRLLFGYNGRLITNPFQLDDSQETPFEHLGEIAVPEERLIEFVRVDLVLNLPGRPNGSPLERTRLLSLLDGG